MGLSAALPTCLHLFLFFSSAFKKIKNSLIHVKKENLRKKRPPSGRLMTYENQ